MITSEFPPPFLLIAPIPNAANIEKINAQRFKEAERGRFNRMNQNLKTSSIAMQKQRDEKGWYAPWRRNG